MIENVYVHTKVEKEIQRLKNQENTPAFAAQKADQIIHALVNGAKPVMAGKLTKNGDARIKRCLKYDLGKGYRLVCVKERKSIYVLYTGSHDSCDTWMDKNKNLKVGSIMDYLKWYSGCCSSSESCEGDALSDDGCLEYDYEDILMKKISQKDLREIFSGFS